MRGRPCCPRDTREAERGSARCPSLLGHWRARAGKRSSLLNGPEQEMLKNGSENRSTWSGPRYSYSADSEEVWRHNLKITHKNFKSGNSLRASV